MTRKRAIKSIDSDGLGEDPTQTILPEDYELNDRDICCGRGKGSWNHPGNQIFQTLVQANAQKYQDAASKNEKSVVVASIVNGILKSGGRFVKQVKDSGRWVDIGETNARDKTGHAIRDFILNRSKRREKQSAKKSAPESKECEKEVCKVVEETTTQSLSKIVFPGNQTSATLRDAFTNLCLPPIPLSYDTSRKLYGLGILDLVDLAVEESGNDEILKYKLQTPQGLSAQEVLEVCQLLSESEEDDDDEDEEDDEPTPYLFVSDPSCMEIIEDGCLLPEDWL